MTESIAPDLRFDPPGGGSWMHDTSHHGRRPVTGFMQSVTTPHFRTDMGTMFEKYGVPLEGLHVEYVHGYGYARPVAVGEGESPRKPPPKPVMWVITRVHPAMRRRNRSAREAWATKAWRTEVDTWFDRDRPAQVGANLRLQNETPAAMSDDELAGHLHRITANLHEGIARSFATHGGDIVPCGDFVAHCNGWGIEPAESSALLQGASPTTTEVIETLAPAARAIAGADRPPESVEEVRRLDPTAERAIDEWLEHHGRRLITSDDLDAPTLAELPSVQLRTLLAVDPDVSAPAPPDPDPVRGRVPVGERDLFDELLAEARYGLRLRDDNVGVNWNWPAGLARRALLEAGSRLAERGVLEQASHVLDLHADEVVSLLEDRGGPDKAEVARRSENRWRASQADPPDHLGDVMEPPPMDAMPAPMARATKAMFSFIEAMQGVDGDPGALTGTGIGSEPYRGRACVVSSAEESFERLADGDVLVTQVTGPAYNSLLPLIGGMVVEAGGAMSHAALVAREFTIPAVIGVRGATGRIADGDLVEVDPAAGAVRVLQPST